jgi:hypothetical protein
VKKRLLYGVVICFLLNSEAINACCYTNDYYLVTNVKIDNSLNVRKEPHPLAPIIGTLNHNHRYFLLVSYGDKNEEMYQHNLCVTVNYASVGGGKSISKWCQLREPKGWVNMHYLKSCEIETSDGGVVIRTQCSDVIKGDKTSDYLFKPPKDISNTNPTQK